MSEEVWFGLCCLSAALGVCGICIILMFIL